MPELAKVATARQAQLKDGRRLGFAEFGDRSGRPVILFHDLWGNRSLRHPDDAILARLGVRLIGVDRPGYGVSTRKPSRGIMDVVDDVMLLSKALKLERFAVLGYSAGGPYALACAYRFPEIVRRCAVVSSLPPMDDPQGFGAVQPVYARLFQLAGGMETVCRLLVKSLFVLDAQRASDQFLRELAAMLPQVDRGILSDPAFFNLRREMLEDIRRNGSDAVVDEIVGLVQTWGFHLQSIRVPVDIWWGESDTFVAPYVGKRMAELIPGATLHAEPRAGHLVLFSHWQAILERLVEF